VGRKPVLYGPDDFKEEFSIPFYDDLAKILIYLDPVSTGYRHDLMLAIQLGIDSSCLKLQMGLENCM
jgi:hypothetical protein